MNLKTKHSQMYKLPTLDLLRDFSLSSEYLSNTKRNTEVTSIHSMIASKEFQDSKYVLPIALGRTISGEPFISDLTRMPHLLIAGDTRQERTLGVKGIITSLLYKNDPSQLKFAQIAIGDLESDVYDLIPELFLAKLPDVENKEISKTDVAIRTLNSLRLEMEARYDLLRLAKVRFIRQYNNKFINGELDAINGHKYLPYIVAVVDNFAALMKITSKDVASLTARISQLGRLVGIHLILVTESTSRIVLTDAIKANFPTRMVFRLSSMSDSMAILDSDEATKLKSDGEMIIDNALHQTQLQCPLVYFADLKNISNYIGVQLLSETPYYLPSYNKG